MSFPLRSSRSPPQGSIKSYKSLLPGLLRILSSHLPIWRLGMAAILRISASIARFIQIKKSELLVRRLRRSLTSILSKPG